MASAAHSEKTRVAPRSAQVDCPTDYKREKRFVCKQGRPWFRAWGPGERGTDLHEAVLYINGRLASATTSRPDLFPGPAYHFCPIIKHGRTVKRNQRDNSYRCRSRM